MREREREINMERIRSIFKAVFTDAYGKFSTKKLWFNIMSVFVIFVPFYLFWIDEVTGVRLLDYIQVVGYGYMALYGGGKVVDSYVNKAKTTISEGEDK